MKKIYYLALVALMGVVLSSCSKNDPEYYQSDLVGYWQKNDTKEFIRFTDEQSERSGFSYGYEWTEPDQTEELLLEERKTLGYPGNGWFDYKLEKDGELDEWHLMNNKGAEIPKIYVVTKLTSSALEYHEKDNKNNKFSFKKLDK